MDAPLSHFMDSGRTFQLYNRDSKEIPQILPKVVATSWKLRQSSSVLRQHGFFGRITTTFCWRVSVSLQFQIMGWRCRPNSWPKILRAVQQLDLTALDLDHEPASLGRPRCLESRRMLFREHSVSGVHVWGFMPKDCSLTQRCLVRTIFSCSRQSRPIAAWSQCRSTLSDHRFTGPFDICSGCISFSHFLYVF